MHECVPSADSMRSGGQPSQGRSQTFPATAEHVPQARRFLTQLLAGSPAADDALLCLSELASNAIAHSRSAQPGGTFTVRVTLQPVLRVEVADQGGPWAPRPDPDGLSGRGLPIVRAVADDFGIAGGEAGRRVWFVLKGGQG
jgi:serine/threonine-protein kinase RsbW